MSNLCILPIAQYRTEYGLTAFLETGSEGGAGVDNGIRAGFAKLLSCEINESRYKQCLERFRNDSRVSLFHGNSLDVLPAMLQQLKVDRCLFWLDAHLPPGLEKRAALQVPLREELGIISEHRDIRTDVFVIDDMVLYEPRLRNPGFNIQDWISDPENIVGMNEILGFFGNHIVHIDHRAEKLLVAFPQEGLL